MTIAELHKDAAAGRRQRRRAYALLLGLSIVGVPSCDQRNLAVISLADVPSSATAITAYYRIDTGAWKSVVPQRGLQQFGLELPKERSAALETQVFAYTNNIPCILGSAAGGAELDGGSIRELALQVSATTERCTTTAEPADFPTGNMAVWANAANDIWLAGGGGKVVHWDGASYSAVPLPAQLMAAPPDWNTIWSDGFDVWIAGTKSAVVRLERGALTVVPILPPAIGPTDWRSITLADPVDGPLLFAGSNRIFGFTNPDLLGIGQLSFNCSGINPPGELTAVTCASNGALYRCFFVTDGGGIAALQSNVGGMAPCRGISSPTTKALFDVRASLNIPGQAYDIRAVGQGGVALRGIALLSSMADPNFLAANVDYSSFIPQSARVDLKRLGGTGLEDLWIVGQGGVLLRWQNTAVNMPPTAPFAQSPTGVAADLSSLSSFGSGVFFSGANKTLGYIGPLFTAN